MEEADRIIIPLLQQIGCPLPAGMESVSQFESGTLIAIVQHILHTIDKRNVFPKRMPEGKAALFRVASTLSGLVGALGYKGEHAFQSFLYPTEKDMRELLNFLVNKLPRSDEKEGGDDADGAGGAAGDNASVSITRLIVDNLNRWGNRSWSVLSSTDSTTQLVSTVPLALPSVDERNRDELRYAATFQPLLSAQCTRTQLAPSLFEINARDVVLAAEAEKESLESNGELTAAKKSAAISSMISSAFRGAARYDANSTSALDQMKELMKQIHGAGSDSSTFTRRTDFSHDTPSDAPAPVVEQKKADQPSEEELKKKLSDDLERVRAAEAAASLQFAELLRRAEEVKASLGPLQSEISSADLANSKIAEDNKSKIGALALLPEADKNLAELTRISEASAKRLLELGEEWEKYRLPLIAAYRRKKQLLNERKDEVGNKIELMRRMREEMKTLTALVRDKDAQLVQVTDELNKLPKAINRQIYVQRIMNIVKNLEKQKTEINSVLGDVRRLQKDINVVSETLSRSFAVADEVVFSVAAEGKKDPTAIQAYKNVVALRTGFEKLVQSVADTGRTKNELLDVQSRIESIETRNSSLNMQRVMDDLASVKGENKTLTAKLKELKARVKK